MKIDFEIEKDGMVFRDAIVLPDDHTMTDEQIESMKQSRFDAWYEVVTNPPEEVIQEEQVVQEQ